MENSVHQMEQEKCENKLEITGVPENIDVFEYTAKIFEKCNVHPVPKKAEYHIQKVTKHGTMNLPKSLVVTFKSKSLRDEVWSKIKKEKPVLRTGEISDQGPSTPIYINELLSVYYKRLLYEAKKIKNDKGYKFLWVQDGKILLRKTENAKILRLNSLDDLGKI